MPSEVQPRLTPVAPEIATNAAARPDVAPATADTSNFGAKLSGSLLRMAREEASASTAVASVRTPITGGQAADALRQAFTRLFGEPPSDGTLSLLVAQWAHETGGGRAMQNYNFGGLKASSSSGAYATYLTHEGSGASRHAQVDRFRAYSSPLEGATDYLKVLHSRFPQAFEAAGRGQCTEFVHALKHAGYFTDSEASYGRSIGALANRALTLGFDAVGQGRTPEAASDPSHQTPNAAPLAASRPAASPLSIPRAVDLTAATDELTRAALRIAARGDRVDEI